MTATLAEVREAIRVRLEQVEGISTAYGYYNGSPTTPCAIVGWPDRHVVGARLGDVAAWEAVIPVQLLVGMGDSQSADVALGRFCDPSGGSSVQEAFDDDPTLDDVLGNGYAVVSHFDRFGVAQFADQGVQYLSCVVSIEVQST